MFFKKKKKIPSNIVSLSDSSDNKILVLFIHGLGGSRKTWEKFELLLRQEEEFKNYIDLAFYTYHTGLFWSIAYKFPNLMTVTDGLQTFIDISCERYEKIILVCHSMGGLVARRYITDRIMYSDEIKITSLLLYATPNSGSDIANFANFFYHSFHVQIRQLCRRSDFIQTLQKNWAYFKISSRIDVRFVVAGLDSVVGEESARNTWGELSYNTDIDKTHLNIIKVTGQEDISYQILRKKIEKLIKSKEEDEQDVQEVDEKEQESQGLEE